MFVELDIISFRAACEPSPVANAVRHVAVLLEAR